MARILAVDDNPDARELLTEILKGRDHAVETAPDAATALAAMSENPPDAVFLDLMMPGMTGMAVLSEIRKGWKTIPIIVLTAVTDDDVARVALDAGAFAYLTKPIDLGDLDRALTAALAQKGTAMP